MKFIYLALNWMFGVLFILSGILFLIETPLIGISFIAMAALLLPPIRTFVYSKTNKELPLKFRASVLIVLFILVGVFTSQEQSKKEQELAAQQAQEKLEKAAQIRQKNIDYFNANRSEILSNIKQAFDSTKYQKVISLSKKYLEFGDQELLKYNQASKTAIAEFKQEVRSLVGKKVPYEKWSEWGSPETLEGTSNKYWVAYLPKANISFVSEKKTDIIIFSGFNKNSAKNFIEQKNKKRKEQLESQFSAWDGSHRNLTELIKKAMNDPGSYDHVETVYWDKGDYLIVMTKYRGNNAFGGKVLGMVKAKVSLNGDILQVIEQQ